MSGYFLPVVAVVVRPAGVRMTSPKSRLALLSRSARLRALGTPPGVGGSSWSSSSALELWLSLEAVVAVVFCCPLEPETCVSCSSSVLEPVQQVNK